MIRQIRTSIRSLLRDRGFTVTTLLTLAVCIGANTAIFAIVHSILLKPLPVPESDSILLMSNHYPKAGVAESSFSGAGDYYDRLKETTVYQQQAMFNFSNVTIELSGRPERVVAMAATPSLLRLLRVGPMIGRNFTDEEGEDGAQTKAILSHGLWQQMFGGDRNIAGRQFRLNGRPFTIVGVMPRDFRFIDPEVRLWLPLAFTAQQKTAHHSNNWYNIGRLKPGASLSQAQSQIDAVNAANLDRFPQMKEIIINAGFYTKVERLQDHLVLGVRSNLYLLWGGALFVLLIGGVNIANLSLARGSLRVKEFATRLALGAGRADLASQMLVEHLLVAVTGGALGLALGATLLRAFPAVSLSRLPSANQIEIDATVVLFALAMAALAGAAAGLIPLAQAGRVSLASVLHEDGRTATSGRRTRLVRRGLVVVQVGFAFVLLFGAGLLLASFRKLLQVDPGFAVEGVVTAATSAPRTRYPRDPELRTLMNRTLEAIRGIPGVIAAGAVNGIPFGSLYNDSVILAEGYALKPGESVISPKQLTVTPGYMETIKIPLVSGRYFNDADDSSAPPVVIIDERLAKRFWPGQSPIGRRMYFPTNTNNFLKTDANTRWIRVVGVTREVRLQDLSGTGTPVGVYYFPHGQSATRAFTWAARTSGDTATVARAIRSAIVAIDPELAVFDVHTMAERRDLSMSSRKTAMTLALGYAGVALFLSAVGIFGVLSYLVTQRRREIGIRLAVGSTAAGILKLVLREGLALAGAGVILGVAGAAALRTAVQGMLYGVGPLDPMVFALAIALLAAVALAACVWPARRAMHVDPAAILSQQ